MRNVLIYVHIEWSVGWLCGGFLMPHFITDFSFYYLCFTDKEHTQWYCTMFSDPKDTKKSLFGHDLCCSDHICLLNIVKVTIGSYSRWGLVGQPPFLVNFFPYSTNFWSASPNVVNISLKFHQAHFRTIYSIYYGVCGYVIYFPHLFTKWNQVKFVTIFEFNQRFAYRRNLP